MESKELQLLQVRVGLEVMAVKRLFQPLQELQNWSFITWCSLVSYQDTPFRGLTSQLEDTVSIFYALYTE